MKFIKQNDEGRLVIDGEGEEIVLREDIPGDSPAELINFRFVRRDGTSPKAKLSRKASQVFRCLFGRD